ncbi:MAG: hypothetical protein M3N95_07745 [Actinomycetota bacterium]|nr:hypothetical protein [Actinomycetota bacterium]
MNSDLAAFLVLPDTTPPARVQLAASKVVNDEGTLLAGLKQASWPAGSQATIATLEAAVAKEEAVYQSCAKAPTVAAIKTILTQNQATIAARAAAAQQVRAAVGLPLATASSSAPATPSTTA